MSPSSKVKPSPACDALRSSIAGEESSPSVVLAPVRSCSERVSSPVPQPRSTTRPSGARLDQVEQVEERGRSLAFEPLVLGRIPAVGRQGGGSGQLVRWKRRRPSRTPWVPLSLKIFFCSDSRNGRLPPPIITGNTISRRLVDEVLLDQKVHQGSAACDSGLSRPSLLSQFHDLNPRRPPWGSVACSTKQPPERRKGDVVQHPVRALWGDQTLPLGRGTSKKVINSSRPSGSDPTSTSSLNLCSSCSGLDGVEHPAGIEISRLAHPAPPHDTIKVHEVKS